MVRNLREYKKDGQSEGDQKKTPRAHEGPLENVGKTPLQPPLDSKLSPTGCKECCTFPVDGPSLQPFQLQGGVSAALLTTLGGCSFQDVLASQAKAQKREKEEDEAIRQGVKEVDICSLNKTLAQGQPHLEI